KNAILADEMGLGKTIQIISFLATLVQDWNCFPFLVVVPNSTCANWRREVKQWAPFLRVVAYFGSKEARDLTYRYELFARDSKELRCHIVVTSYDCAADDSARKFFKSIPWQALIVDEGQRLKSDKSQLYSALASLRAPFKVLLTGTPLQNNARELFNLLQFLDDTFDASQLEEKFHELDQAKIQELHGIIRPFFLRRTKAQVLTFLPPMAQVIVPVSMSTVQKKLYKTILAKNPDLMRAIFQGAKEFRPTERASLNNILMQLRKCLCHPFVYSTEIEERNVSQAVSHRNLVDASGKLQLLEMLLPKLKERGHRVLIFSQFLDMLTMVEDFLDGMQMRCQRLDGTISSLEKQKRIDEFNAPDSPLFAFLLSTRAGGVGINLVTADTVIILDPDFNPHQDIQALSRAHRIGQKKKVLCFQIVTRASAEEKIMSYGRRKMALDHVLIEQMDAEDATDRDLEGILRH
ncbi:SNF2 family DNA-dependent chromodomain-containing ATPase, partial [Aureobasidium melanogenum]